MTQKVSLVLRTLSCPTLKYILRLVGCAWYSIQQCGYSQHQDLASFSLVSSTCILTSHSPLANNHCLKTGKGGKALLTYCVPGAMTSTNMLPQAVPRCPAGDLEATLLFLSSCRMHSNTCTRQMEKRVVGMGQVRRVCEL